MRVLTAALVVVALLVGAHADDVITISGQAQLDELIKKHAFVAAEFYAPWCGHCKKLEPEWSKAATALKGHDPEIVLVKADATDKENESMKGKYGISGFPTLKIFRGDSSQGQAYEGPREADGIVAYLKKQVLPAYSQLETAEAVASAKAASETALLVAYLASNTSDEFKTFTSVAAALRNDLDFAYVTDHSLLEECSGSDCTSPFVIIYKKGESEQPRYTGAFTADLLKTWASAKSLPLVIRFGVASQMRALQKAFQGTGPKLVAFAPEDGVTAELSEQLEQASKANADLAVVLATEKEGKRIIDYYGVKPAGKVAFLIDDPANKAKYLKEDAKPSDIPEFMREFTEGALEKWTKSEPIPAKNDGPVKVVVGRNFEDEVIKSGKDVFIEFYAPWCGHCNKLKPIWEELGQEFEGDESVVIAKMDSTANDNPLEAMAVKGFPTLYFRTAAGEVKKYEGDRSKEDLIKYVKANCGSCKGKAAAADEDEEEEEEEEKDEL